MHLILAVTQRLGEALCSAAWGWYSIGKVCEPANSHSCCRLQVKEGKKPKFKLGVADPKLGAAIQDETSIPCVCNEFTGEVGA